MRERSRKDFNPTNAQKIDFRDFELESIDTVGGGFKIKLNNLNLKKYNLPAQANVSLYVQKGSGFTAFENFGNLASISSSEVRDFTEDFKDSRFGRVKCRLNVTDTESNKYLAFSDFRHPINNKDTAEESREKLIDVKAVPMKTKEIWNFKIFDDESLLPQIELNEKIDNIYEHFKRDAKFISLVLPSCIKRGFKYIFNQSLNITSEDTWQHKWFLYLEQNNEELHKKAVDLLENQNDLDAEINMDNILSEITNLFINNFDGYDIHSLFKNLNNDHED